MLAHRGTREIRTQRLLLRPFRADDAQAMYDNWAGDARVCRFLAWDPHEDAAMSRRVIESWLSSAKDLRQYHWAMVWMGRPVGSMTVVDIRDRNDACEIGYCLSRMLWGRGLTAEALRGVMAYLFYDVGFYRIMARHHAENSASGRVMEKAGMRFEGMQRGAAKMPGGSYSDLRVYAALRPEWSAVPDAGGFEGSKG